MSTPDAAAADRSRWRRPVLVGSLVLAALAAAALAVLLSDVAVLAKGQLLPYTEGEIYQVRFGNLLTLYVEPEQRPNSDLLVSYLLTGAAFVALTFGIVLWAGGRRRGIVPAFFWVAFVGLSYLVADEMLGIHESIGHNLPGLRTLPLIERPDDAILLLMAAAGVLMAFYFRRVVLASRAATWLIAAGLGCMLGAAVGDVLGLPFEELLEVAGAVCALAAVIALGLCHTRLAPLSILR